MRAIIYLRKSTDREDKQKLSIEGQLQECQKIVEREGFDVIETIEDKQTAKEPGRPWFAKMMTMISKNQVDVLVVWEMSRIARNPIDAGSISWVLQNNQIQAIHSSSGVFRSTDKCPDAR